MSRLTRFSSHPLCVSTPVYQLYPFTPLKVKAKLLSSIDLSTPRWDTIRVWVGRDPGVGGRKTGCRGEGIRVESPARGERNRVTPPGGKESGSYVGEMALYPALRLRAGLSTRFLSHPAFLPPGFSPTPSLAWIRFPITFEAVSSTGPGTTQT